MTTGPGDGEVDVDAAWAQIIAHWDDEPAAPRSEPFDRVAVEQARTDGVDAAGTDDAPGDTNVDVTTGETTPTADPNLGWDEIALIARGEIEPAARGRTSGTAVGDPAEEPNRRAGGRHRHSGSPDADPEIPPTLEVRADPEPTVPDGDVVARRPGPRDADPDGPSLLDDLEDDHYEPPEPPPLPRPDPISALGWLGAIGAPLLLLFAALFWRTAPAIVIGLAVLAFIGGFVTLVVRMPDRNDDGDDGAVV